MVNVKSLSVFLVFFLAGMTVNASFAAEKTVTTKADVRLLIDISGSMKKNDPNNLRIPALQLVTNLLPKGADAGVWAFGRYVNMMVPLSKVDAKWQEKATKTATKINSRGLYTNIGDVLQKASYGWGKPDPREKRSLILLTDGMVDISKDKNVNAKERVRILKEVLPKLKKAGVSIHTIALSQNADHDLLKQLSTQTDGWYQAVNNASELQKVFLKIFEQAAQRDNLPISDNLFTVDKSIDEMTVLIFRKDSSSSAKLISPTDKVFDKNTKDKSIRWFSTEGYDLVTLQKPEVGDWKIDADVDPDNRVMVVSKLGLSVAELPNNLLAGEAINYELQLLEEGNKISKMDFLKLVDAKLELDKSGQKSKMAMFFDQSSHTFKQNFFTDSFEGELKLRLHVTSPTFERVRTHAINIYGSPIELSVDISEDNIKPHKVSALVKKDIVELNSLKVNATILKPDGEKIYHVIDNFTSPFDITADLTGGKYQIDLKITGKSVLGREFSVTPNTFTFEANSLIDDGNLINEPPKEVEKKIEETKPKVVENEKPVEQKSDEQDKNDKIEEEEGQINWMYVGLGGNAILGILGFFVWRIIKKRSAKNAALAADELGIEEDDEEDDDVDVDVDDVDEKDKEDTKK